MLWFMLVYLIALIIILYLAEKHYRAIYRKIRRLVEVIYLDEKYKLEKELKKDLIKSVQGDGTGNKKGKVSVSGGLEEEVEFFKKKKDEPSDDDYFEQAKGTD